MRASIRFLIHRGREAAMLACSSRTTIVNCGYCCFYFCTVLAAHFCAENIMCYIWLFWPLCWSCAAWFYLFLYFTFSSTHSFTISCIFFLFLHFLMRYISLSTLCLHFFLPLCRLNAYHILSILLLWPHISSKCLCILLHFFPGSIIFVLLSLWAADLLLSQEHTIR